MERKLAATLVRKDKLSSSLLTLPLLHHCHPHHFLSLSHLLLVIFSSVSTCPAFSAFSLPLLLSSPSLQPHLHGDKRGGVGCGPQFFSGPIIAPFSADTAAACGTNLPLPISSQRALQAPPEAPAALADPQPVSGGTSSPQGSAAGPLSQNPAHRQGHPG